MHFQKIIEDLVLIAKYFFTLFFLTLLAAAIGGLGALGGMFGFFSPEFLGALFVLFTVGVMYLTLKNADEFPFYLLGYLALFLIGTIFVAAQKYGTGTEEFMKLLLAVGFVEFCVLFALSFGVRGLLEEKRLKEKESELPS